MRNSVFEHPSACTEMAEKRIVGNLRETGVPSGERQKDRDYSIETRRRREPRFARSRIAIRLGHRRHPPLKPPSRSARRFHARAFSARRRLKPVDKLAQALEPYQLAGKSRKVRIDPAWIGQREDPRTGEDFGFDTGASAYFVAEKIPIYIQPDESDHLRFQAADFPLQAPHPAFDFVSTQLRGGGRGAIANIGQRDSEFDQTMLLLGSESKRDQTARGKELPERVPQSGEMMSEASRVVARIDTYQQDTRPLDNYVAHSHG